MYIHTHVLSVHVLCCGLLPTFLGEKKHFYVLCGHICYVDLHLQIKVVGNNTEMFVQKVVVSQ
jgi:hypothetical protein